MKAESLWVDTSPGPPARPPLRGNASADVAVLGGGIVGITTALLLAESGARVALLEADRLARSVSGRTTAKLTSQHGLVYSRLRSKFGLEGARTYATANEAALAWIAERVARDRVDCDFRRQPAYLYMSRGGDRAKLEAEAEAAIEAGLPASLVEATPLPYPVEAALLFTDQAEFHVRKYLLPLADRLEQTGGAVYEESRALTVESGHPCIVKTAEAELRADRVVIATHYPFLDRSLAFARVHPDRSYVIACRLDGAPPSGMHISGDSPTRSLRAVPLDGEELLLVSGEGHRTGEGGDTEMRYRRLEEFAREHWRVQSVDYRWSTQDNATVDGVPYVGRLTPRSERLFMATGFSKWGMTGGTAAALLLHDLLLGRDSAWADLYDPNRFKPFAAASKLVEENLRVGLHFFGDRARKRGIRPIEELVPGEGDIVRHDGEKVAGHRRDDGTLVAVSPRCTHLGCQLSWNPAERSWDCPCHGSRFSPEGKVLHGPAVRPLANRIGPAPAHQSRS
jgi:glycine/D-amino acid oxidase-like deaminating enzyme/nitrite reductase/ring-hydroxylating ferredoxin subunit